MKAKCIDNKTNHGSITLNKIYEVYPKEGTDFYELIDDKGKSVELWKYRFEIIEENKKYKPEIFKKIIFNGPATIVYWNDNKDDKTVVKTCKGDEFNPQLGFLVAYFEKNSGLTKTQCNKFLNNLKQQYEDLNI